MDVLDMIYQVMIADAYIKEKAFNRIKYYEYPETGAVNAPFIIIDPIDAPNPSDFADNTWLKYDCLFQIDVWTPNRIVTSTIADKIRDILWNEFGFVQKSGPQDFDAGIFRDARRYRGTIYRNDIDNL